MIVEMSLLEWFYRFPKSVEISIMEMGKILLLVIEISRKKKKKILVALVLSWKLKFCIHRYAEFRNE